MHKNVSFLPLWAPPPEPCTSAKELHSVCRPLKTGARTEVCPVRVLSFQHHDRWTREQKTHDHSLTNKAHTHTQFHRCTDMLDTLRSIPNVNVLSPPPPHSSTSQYIYFFFLSLSLSLSPPPSLILPLSLKHTLSLLSSPLLCFLLQPPFRANSMLILTQHLLQPLKTDGHAECRCKIFLSRMLADADGFFLSLLPPTAEAISRHQRNHYKYN